MFDVDLRNSRIVTVARVRVAVEDVFTVEHERGLENKQ